MRPYERNHDGAALGPSVGVSEVDQRSVYPHTVHGSASFPDYERMAHRQNMLHTTYLYLAVAVFGAMAGAWFGAHNEAFLKFAFSGIFFWVGAMIVLNAMPVLALKTAHNAPRLAIPALGLNGFVSGLILGPLVFLGLAYSGQDPTSGNLVSTALMITGAMFAGVTAYVFLNKKNFKASGAMMWGMFGFAVVAIPLNVMFQSALLSSIIALVIGALGIYQLAIATSRISNDPNFDSPAAGALMLFAGVFNLFQAILSLLLSMRD